MAKYFFYYAEYEKDNVAYDVSGYISDALFSSEEEMKWFLEEYYHPSIHVVEISESEASEALTDEELENLLGKGFDPSWMKGRTSLFETIYVTEDGHTTEYPSGRQPRIKNYVNK